MKTSKTKLTDLQLAEAVLSGKTELTEAKMTSLIKRLAKTRGPYKDMDSRICFGIEFYDSEESAELGAIISRLMGNTYNGGWFHGMACGRDKSFDYVVNEEHIKSARPDDALIREKVAVGTKLYAVTV